MARGALRCAHANTLGSRGAADAFGPPSNGTGETGWGDGVGGGGHSPGAVQWWDPTIEGLLAATPLIVFSFGCQAQVIPLFNALQVSSVLPFLCLLLLLFFFNFLFFEFTLVWFPSTL